VVAVAVAIAGGVYAVSGDGGGGGRGGRSTTTTEIDRSGLPVDGPGNTPPTGAPEFDELAQGCFEGSMADCDTLDVEAADAMVPDDPTPTDIDVSLALDYSTYGETCGGRRPAQIGLCVRAFADAE
jgi:hypothetical protein